MISAELYNEFDNWDDVPTYLEDFVCFQVRCCLREGKTAEQTVSTIAQLHSHNVYARDFALGELRRQGDQDEPAI